MSEVKGRYNWYFGEYRPEKAKLNKKEIIDSYIAYMLVRTMEIFEYKNLPETIPPEELELILQLDGKATIYKFKDNIYAFRGSNASGLDMYYKSFKQYLTNPWINLSKEVVTQNLMNEKQDSVLILNDKLRYGLLPMFERNAILLSNIDISINNGAINARLPNIAVAQDSNTAESFKTMMSKIEDDGEVIAVVNQTLEELQAINTYPFNNSSSNSLMQLIELRNYILSSWYMELGLKANNNMKREAINESEADLSEDILLPLIDDMLACRKKGIEEVNKFFNLNICVDYSSSWKKLREDIELHLKTLEDSTEKDSEEVEEPKEEEIKNED